MVTVVNTVVNYGGIFPDENGDKIIAWPHKRQQVDDFGLWLRTRHYHLLKKSSATTFSDATGEKIKILIELNAKKKT